MGCRKFFHLSFFFSLEKTEKYFHQRKLYIGAWLPLLVWRKVSLFKRHAAINTSCNSLASFVIPLVHGWLAFKMPPFHPQFPELWLPKAVAHPGCTIDDNNRNVWRLHIGSHAGTLRPSQLTLGFTIDGSNRNVWGCTYALMLDLSAPPSPSLVSMTAL